MQPHHRGVSDDHVAELLERWSDGVRDSDLLDGVVEEVAEKPFQLLGESVVEASMKIPHLSPWA